MTKMILKVNDEKKHTERYYKKLLIMGRKCSWRKFPEIRGYLLVLLALFTIMFL